jgi:hypothetical protein
MSTTPASSIPAPKTWALLELFGHGRLAGQVSEHNFGGQAFTRVDVPEVILQEPIYVDGQRATEMRVIPAHTKLIGGSAIYSIAFVDEAAALLAAHAIKHEPVRAWELRDVLQKLPLADRRALLEHDDGDRVF